MIFYTLKRLFNFVRIVAGYFFGSDIVDAFRKIAGARGLLEKVENDCKEELFYLNKKEGQWNTGIQSTSANAGCLSHYAFEYRGPITETKML